MTRKTSKKLGILVCIAGMILVSLNACGNDVTPTEAGTAGEQSAEETTGVEPETSVEIKEDMEEEIAAPESGSSEPSAPEIEGLAFDHAMELEYAEGFNVYYYNDGYKLIDIPISGTYLIVPDGREDPASLPYEDTQIIHQDLKEIYLAATSAMSFFDELNAIDTITMCGTDAKGWYIDAPKQAFQNGSMIYAGKYSAPEYETLVNRDCDLAIESTMILHAPDVEEMLRDLEIPVLIDRSSYELTAFGRIEWIKVYGALLNKEETAEQFFEDQKKVLSAIDDYENTGKTVAFFSINTDGSIVVRKTEDFIPNMISLAGGNYVFEDLKNLESSSASVAINMEEFYDVAAAADFLVYNATIEDPITDVNTLIDRDDLFAEFKAVQNGDVWQVDRTWYQSTALVGHLITDFNIMITDGDRNELMFLSKVGE